MAELVEKQIRDALVNALKGLATTKQSVFPYRFYPAAKDDLPALLVYTDEEDLPEDERTRDKRGIIKAHHLEVRVEVMAKQTQDVEDKIALIYQEVITALEADPTLAGLLTGSTSIKYLRNTGNRKDIDEDGEQPAIAGIMTWQADYRTVEGTPDASVS